MEKDWIFSGETYSCGVRVAGVWIRQGCILLQREENGQEYAVPGGHIHIGETLESGLKREWLEETGLSICCRKMLWTEECFWEWKGKRVHNLSFYYRIALEDEAKLPDEVQLHSHKDNSRILLEWVPVENVADLTVYPAFLKTEIHRLEGPVQHFVTRA